MPPSTRAGRKPDRPYHHGNLRRGLLDEALATIRAEGVDGLTLREIGEVLGVTESRVSQLHTKAILRLKARLSGSPAREPLGR